MRPLDGRQRPPRSEAHRALGQLLREARGRAGLTTRQLGFSSGHISNVEGGHVTPSRDLLAAYVAIGAAMNEIGELADQIDAESRLARTSQRRGQRNHRPVTRAPDRIGPRTTGNEVRNHYRVVAYELTLSFDDAGRVWRGSSTVGIRAVTSEVSIYYTGHTPDDSHRVRSSPRVHVHSGGTIEQVRISPLGAMDLFIRLDHPIHPGDREPALLAYDIEFETSERADPCVYYFTRPGIETHRVTCEFTAPSTPTAVWWIAAPDGFQVDQPDPKSRIPLHDSGRYTHMFDPVAPGWIYGLAWTWPEG